MNEEKKEVTEETVKPKVDVLDEKGRCENTRLECRTIYILASGLSGVRDQSGKVIVEKKLSGQPAYAFGRIKDKLRSVAEGLDEARQLPTESGPSKYGQEYRELKSEYGKIDETGSFAFYEGTTEEERIEFRLQSKKLKTKYPDTEKDIDKVNATLKIMGKEIVRWEPFLVDIESQLGKLSPDEWEWFGRTDKDGKFLFLNGTKERLEECLKEYKEDERKNKKKCERE